MRAHAGGHGSNVCTRDGVALLGHRRGRSTLVIERLREFSHFGLHEKFEVRRELGTRPSQECKEPANFGNTVAFCVPSDLGNCKPETLGKCFLARQRFVGGERGKGTSCTPELEHEDPWFELLEALLVSLEGNKKAGKFEAECHRDGLLKVASSNHGRGGMALCKRTKVLDDFTKRHGDDLECRRKLKDSCSVCYVLFQISSQLQHTAWWLEESPESSPHNEPILQDPGV